jgi:hypothetical protein
MSEKRIYAYQTYSGVEFHAEKIFEDENQIYLGSIKLENDDEQ